MNKLIISALAAACTLVPALSACSNKPSPDGQNNELQSFLPDQPAEREAPISPPETPIQPENPASAKTVSYIVCNANGLNVRTGANTSSKILGTAQSGEIFYLAGEQNGFYKTLYRGVEAYVSKNYCGVITMASANDETESVILQGCALLGTPYVYGATRYHDGSGKRLSGFSSEKFDCSSLMQYIFYAGAGKLLQVNTRTQVLQGEEVEKQDIRRGDLLFFTNESRQYKRGVERVGHVALYLGDNRILHTSSDYAKIESISPKRWQFFICARRV